MMEDPESENQPPNRAQLTLPPGCRFYPSEEQLLSYYLANKNNANADDSNQYGCNVIKELDLSNFKPYELPESACFAYGYGGRKRHWYCYTIRVLKESGGGRRRMVKGGYWRKKRGVRNVMSRIGRVVLGTRTRFVFYLGNSPKNAVKTDWIMYEYSLGNYAPEASFVLCRVFVKSHGENSMSDNVLSCCAVESVSAVRHTGIQHDGLLAPDMVEADISRYSVTVVIELDDQATTGHNFQLPLDIPLVSTPGLIGGDALVDAIQNEDFIQLDDLLD